MSESITNTTKKETKRRNEGGKRGRSSVVMNEGKHGKKQETEVKVLTGQKRKTIL